MFELAAFNLNQQRYIAFMLQNPNATQRAAAKHLGITDRAISAWPSSVDAAITSALEESLQSSKDLIERHALEAVMVLVSQLKSADERIAHAAAVKLLEWSIGKPKQALEHTGKDNTPLTVRIIWTDADDNNGHGYE